MKPFTRQVHEKDVGELIDLTVIGDNQENTRSMADMQLEGVAALYNILCKRNFAYLADEVGMGKTYQALALAALLWNEKPDARILFISPRQNLQVKWVDDYRRFFASNYRRRQGLGDDRAASVLFGRPVHRPVHFDNLRTWAVSLGMPERIASFVRHTSFSRPVYLTSNDLDDMDDLWSRTRGRLRACGLFGVKRPRKLSPERASEQLNLAFAAALNTKIREQAGEQCYFDLVIVDEAQCLRNPDNQRNRVLFTSLKGHVNKWLFMSATPAHGGPGDLPTILNHYPDCGEVLDPELTEDLPALQNALQTCLVRRQRRYRTKPNPTTVGKDRYRHHDPRGWGVRDREMTALGTLAMALVQKGLVGVLQGRNNRYRIGFLSSFESLQSSIRGTLPAATSDLPRREEEASGDWHRDSSDGFSESQAPDSDFIQHYASDFEKRFGMPLPHPKIDSVVDRIAPLAFGSDTQRGGHKFLIFTRRVSTVHTLRDRLMLRHKEAIEARIQRCWGIKLDWTGKSIHTNELEGDDDPEGFDSEGDESPFRKAMSKGGWLFRYRQTFRTSGRNATFFEDGWLSRLCRAGGVDPEVAAAELPDELWAESWTHASQSSGKSRRQHRAQRVRYLAVQALRRFPRIFGLDNKSAAPWKAAYEAALHGHLERAKVGRNPHRAPQLFTQQTLWTAWDKQFPEGPMALPVATPHAQKVSAEDLHRRQVARTLLGQTFRLTDTLLDLYFADNPSKTTASASAAFPQRFLDWLATDDASARKLRHDCSQWLAHLRLIVDSCLDGGGREWRELAREESWEQLFNPQEVIGVTGGSGAHRTATRQFRTPSLARVIVCTDVLKEGVDLHLFCDRVLHYGVAWTAGDLEQRVGRVDRFFSQIERRLSQEGAPPDVRLDIGYPHVVASLERNQVERVIERQKRAELLMDSPLAGANNDSKDMIVGAHAARLQKRDLGPYQPHHRTDRRRNIVMVSQEAARKSADHYIRWYAQFKRALARCGRQISPDDPKPVRIASLDSEVEREIKWTYDAALHRYILTFSSVPQDTETALGEGMRRRLTGKVRRVESFIRLLVPTPMEAEDGSSIAHLIAALDGQAPRADANAALRWQRPLAALASDDVQWLSDHRARIVVPRGNRSQSVTLSAHEGGVHIASIVAPLKELDICRNWGGAPTAERVRDWALDNNNLLPLGYLDVHSRDGLVFNVHVLHGKLSDTARRKLIQEVAWRADAWEAALTGDDRQ